VPGDPNTQTGLHGGFARPVFDAQAVFRIVLDAMAHPGRVNALPPLAAPPAPLSPEAGAVLCTLCDADTPLWLDPALQGSSAVRSWLTFHCGAPLIADTREAAFAALAGPAAMPDLAAFAQGSADYPDRSTTLVLQLPALSGGPALALRGPGIERETILRAQGLPEDFVERGADNAARFPCGVDLVLVAAGALACLPRSARIQPRGD
jgi:alpha-D-ribose 1-methylphosphonate 5-triphosphate synthase subunit PhnH